MEEYRRKYMSPSYSQRSSYASPLQKDKTVAELRQELQQCKEMEQKFDDLCLQIVRLERQNKKIQSQQACVESEYIQKIKKNKQTITQLKQGVLDCRQSIENRTRKITLLQQANHKLTLEVTRLQQEKTQYLEVNQKAKEQIAFDQLQKEEKTGVVEAKKQDQKEMNSRNQIRSSELEQQLRDLKEKETALRNEERVNLQLQNQIASAHKERQLWDKKVIVSESEGIELRAEANTGKERLSQLQLQCYALEKENRKISENHLEHRSDIKKLVLENRELASTLKESQERLSQAMKIFQEQQLDLDREHVKEAELRKERERLEEGMRQLTETLQEEQESYSRTIRHMRQSIQQDERAIESLVKQATSLQTMIS